MHSMWRLVSEKTDYSDVSLSVNCFLDYETFTSHEKYDTQWKTWMQLDNLHLQINCPSHNEATIRLYYKTNTNLETEYTNAHMERRIGGGHKVDMNHFEANGKKSSRHNWLDILGRPVNKTIDFQPSKSNMKVYLAM